MVFEILLMAFALGFLDGALPGPVTTTICINLLLAGLKPGIKTFLWASLFEVLIAVAFVFVVLGLNVPDAFFYRVGFLGGGLLIYFSTKVFQIVKISILKHKKIFFTPLNVLEVSVFSPWLYLAWVLIYFPLLLRAKDIFSGGEFYFFGILEFGVIAGFFTTLLIVAFARQLLKNEKVIHRVFQFFAILLFIFGIKMIWDSASFFGII